MKFDHFDFLATCKKIVLEILAEDVDVSWEVVESLLPEVQVRLKYKLTINQRASVAQMVQDMLDKGEIGGTWPEVWAKEGTVSEIDKLRIQLKAMEATVEDLKKNGRPVEKIVEVPKYIGVQLMRGKKIEKKIEMTFHKEFQTVLDLAEMRMNIFLFGPTGCGKSFICEQLATALALPFGFVSCTAGMSEGVIGGKLLPVGRGGNFEYVTSEFVKFYENGGVFLLDEIDAADANVLLFINAALASSTCPVSNRVAKPYAKKHDDFVCIAAANTAGTNADRLYSGRNKLDGATLDRFQVGKVMMDYDIEVERKVCPDEELLKRCHVIRKSIEDNRLERAMSTRFIRDAYLMKTERKWPIEKIDRAYFAGWREDEVNKVRTDLRKELGSSSGSGSGKFAGFSSL